jgi:hypothetical protein
MKNLTDLGFTNDRFSEDAKYTFCSSTSKDRGSGTFSALVDTEVSLTGGLKVESVLKTKFSSQILCGKWRNSIKASSEKILFGDSCNF